MYAPDYCNGYTVILDDQEAIFSSSELILEESSTYLRELYENGKIISHLGMFLQLKHILQTCSNRIIKTSSFYSRDSQIKFELNLVPL